MPWIYLACAIVFEVAGTTCMKLSDGFAHKLPSICLFIFYGCSFVFLTLALKHIEVSIAYAVWSGLGIALISVIGVVWFGESMAFIKIAALVTIVVAVITLNIISRHT